MNAALDSAIRFYTVLTGLLATLSLLLRVAYQLGKILESFHKHIKESDDAHKEFNSRITYLERRRR